MGKNLRALVPDEFEYINNKYKFSLLVNGVEIKPKEEYNKNAISYIIVETSDYNRRVLQDIDKPFSINTPIRRLTISKDAIDMWIEYFKYDFTLIEVQSAISALIVTYQKVDATEVKKQMLRQNATIKTN